jgi:hypothetical protein
VHDVTIDNNPAMFRRAPAGWGIRESRDEIHKGTYFTGFNPDSYMIALEQFVRKENVDLLYGIRVCSVVREGNQITHLITESKSGREAIAVKCVIDASGDADVCHLAGEETVSLNANVAAGWFYHYDEKGLHLNQLTRKYRLPDEGRESDGREYWGDNTRELSEQVFDSREMILARMSEIRAKDPEKDFQLLSPPIIPCVRMTRRLAGRYTLSLDDLHQWHDDAITITGNWRVAGQVYAIPFRSICAVKNTNLMAIGRCMSSDTMAWDATRGIATCTATGQGAGTAAALAIKTTQNNLHQLNIPDLQAQLKKDDVLLDPALLHPIEKKK